MSGHERFPPTPSPAPPSRALRPNVLGARIGAVLFWGLVAALVGLRAACFEPGAFAAPERSLASAIPAP